MVGQNWAPIDSFNAFHDVVGRIGLTEEGVGDVSAGRA
jgi:hypothetical protein